MSQASITGVSNPILVGSAWIGKCLAAGIAVVVAWQTGSLKEVTLLIIVGFVLFRGVLPFFLAMRELLTDMSRSREERQVLASVSVVKADEIADQDSSEAGSYFKLVQAVIVSRDRMSATTATRAYLSRFDAYWTAKLQSLADAGEFCPMLGLMGTLCGLVLLLEQLGADTKSLLPALSTVFQTTLAGVFGYLTVSGLASIARNAVGKFRSELDGDAGDLSRLFDDDDNTSSGGFLGL